MTHHHKAIIPTHSFFSGFDDFLSTPFFTDEEPIVTVPIIANFERQANSILRRSSPCYEVTEDETQFQLAVDVPGVKAGDLNIQLEQGGRVLRLSGGRKVRSADGKNASESKFEKSFTIDRSIDANKITANLADGVLVITAPKDVKKDEVQKIAVTEHPHKLSESQ
jgi:HSP20 family protein